MKRIYFFITILVLFSLTGCKTDEPKKKDEEKSNANSNITSNSNINTDINAVTSLEDKIDKNYVWCGTFNIAWNILKDEFVGGDVVISPELEQVNNLNKSTFTSEYLNSESYYTNYGRQTPALKEEIEKAIKKKFNQESKILDSFKWEENTEDDFMYAMLYKKYEFKESFKQLDNDKFNNEGDFRYFGINSSNKDGANQVEVLYFEDYNNNAIKIISENGDEIILAKGINKDSFLESYNELIDKTNKFDGEKTLDSDESITIPYIKFDITKEYSDLYGKIFEYKNKERRKIAKALQSIKLELNESGGDLVSEAGISTEKETASIEEKVSRHFTYNSTFTLFIKEKDKELPYFAAYIDSLDMFQQNN